MLPELQHLNNAVDGYMVLSLIIFYSLSYKCEAVISEVAVNLKHE